MFNIFALLTSFQAQRVIGYIYSKMHTDIPIHVYLTNNNNELYFL